MFVRSPRGPRTGPYEHRTVTCTGPPIDGSGGSYGPRAGPARASYKHLRVSYGRREKKKRSPKKLQVTGPVGFWKLLLDCFDTSERGASSESDSSTPAVQSIGVSTWGFSSASSSCRLRFFVFALVPLFWSHDMNSVFQLRV